MSPVQESPLPRTPAGLPRRLASMAYELLLLTALILVMTFPFVGMTGGKVSTYSRYALQFYLAGLCGLYFTWFWSHGGQTLPMKTWRIRVETADAKPLSATLAWKRYVLATLGTLMFGITYFWSLFDRDKQFLHDRLIGTRIMAMD